MDFALLLGAVFVITQTSVLARPTDTESSIDDSSMDNKEESEDIMFTFPTQVTHGFSVTINGTLKSANETLTVKFPSSSNEEQECVLVYNFTSKMLEISPAPEGEDAYIVYDVSELISKTDQPKFSLRLRAMQSTGNLMFKVTLNINNAGDSEILACPLPSFEDYGKIVFNGHIETISSLLFEFAP